MYEVKRTMQEEAWKRFLDAERAALEERRSGEAVGSPGRWAGQCPVNRRRNFGG
ncbi:hypothetical protein BH24ACT19_BH24ACT19_19580 [soil metagenome]